MPTILVVLLEVIGSFILGVGILLAIFVVSHYTTGVRIRREKIQTDRFHGTLHIAFMSDMHFGRYSPPWTTRSLLSKMSRLTDIDLVVLGGDYIDLESRYIPLLDKLLETIRQNLKVPIVGVLGNHEDEAPDEIRACFRRQSANLLENEALRFTKGGEPYLVIGVKDVTHPDISYPGEDPIKWYTLFDDVDPDLFRILVCHNPKGIELPGKRRPDLVLSGHTHGGALAPLRFYLSRFHGGLERIQHRMVDGSVQIISWGLGSYGASFGKTISPMRFLTPFEVVVVDITHDPSGGTRLIEN